MIYTLTLNPALDYYIETENLIQGTVNRAVSAELKIGGKGLNVSRVLSKLGLETVALGFVGGFTGEVITKGCEFNTDFITLEQNTRINVKLKDSDTETEINGLGAEIPKEKLTQLFEKAKKITENDMLIMCGSLPKNLPFTFYRDFAKATAARFVITDTSGKALSSALEMKHFLIKPNIFELEELFNRKINTLDETVTYAVKLLETTENVLVSMGEKGAVLVNRDTYFYVPAAKGRVLSAVGAGDTLLAAFVADYLKNKDLKSALEFAAETAARFVFTGVIGGATGDMGVQHMG
ncbi:MAG: 1-phosphofructokinase family hexose kinase [Oscillospiraceae bacterium]|jgi:1-phosphofructokinase|nr:1-phosphofructokinase family hexose kinase [Oscillospiraceae bacterium]